MMECRTIICCTNDSWLPADDQDGYFRFETAPAIPRLDDVEARHENPFASEPAAIRDAYDRGEIEWPNSAEQPAAQPAACDVMAPGVDVNKQIANRTWPGPSDKKNSGLYHKYNIYRTDGTDRIGGKHHGCKLFVLDLTHDPHAIQAIRAYANSCAEDYPRLAIDLRAMVGTEDKASADDVNLWLGHLVTYASPANYDRAVGARDRIKSEFERLTENCDLQKYIIREWLEKTEWVQTSLDAPAGKHRADVIREEFEQLKARIAELETQLAECDREIESCCAQLDVWKKTAADRQTRIDSLAAEHDARGSEILRLNRELKESASRAPQSAEFERRVEACCADSVQHVYEQLIKCQQVKETGIGEILRKHFAPTQNTWREPREVPQSPWVVLKLESDAEVPAIFTGRLFTSDQDVVYSQADITGWRYAVSEPEGERFEGFVTCFGGTPYNSQFTAEEVVDNEFPATLYVRKAK